MTYEQILKDIGNKIYYPVYLLQGEEPYYIDKISDFIENKVLNETEKEFNLTILYGKETTTADVIASAKRYPMLSNLRVVILKEAQELKNIENLLPYISNPLKSTILVLCHKYKKLDGKTVLSKKISQLHISYTSDKLQEKSIPDWINKYVKEINYKINPEASNMLADFLGNDLGKISNEITKLTLNLPIQSSINEENILSNIGISKEFNIVQLRDALAEKNLLKANKIINYFSQNLKENPIIKSINMLFKFFNDALIYKFQAEKRTGKSVEGVYESYYLKNIAKNYSINQIIKVISYLREFDLKIKGIEHTSADEPAMYKELIYKILH